MTQGSYQPNGSSTDRARRRAWLIETFRADQDLIVSLIEIDGEVFEVPVGAWTGSPACRCYRCGRLLCEAPGKDWHVTVDRIIPGCRGGTYRRNNIRPACFKCNSELGGALRASKRGRSRQLDSATSRRSRPVRRSTTTRSAG